MDQVTIKETEMLDFFGKEPEVLDAGVPWIYNTLTYKYAVGQSNIIFKFAPSYRRLTIQLRYDDQIIYDFNGDIEDVLFDKTAISIPILRIRPNHETELILVVKPTIKLSHVEPTK